MSNHPHAERLRQIVAQPDTVLFVGAGVASWSGLPTWPQLIAELADFLDTLGHSSHLVRRELAQRDLLQAASFAFELLTLQDRATFLRQACRVGEAQPSALHRRLATLGPRCFITTNYDKLLEQALTAERADLAFQVVNNVNLVETASIIRSRARDFVFKPHGDVDASDSIVMTREQYRDLRGERRHAFEAFKTLLASRPVVFVGFGLRDPDFLLIKDTLATIYQGAAQDHYALVPDVDEQEVGYWRNHYGIHLTSYETQPDAADPVARHGALLPLLDVLAGAAPTPKSRRVEATTSAEAATLSVLRHARRMQQLKPVTEGEPLPVEGSPVPRDDTPMLARRTLKPFQEGDAVDGLCSNRERLLLTGAPGAGKTFAIRTAVGSLARELIDRTLRADGADADARVPTYVDLRDYADDLWTTVSESFPLGFPLDELVKQGRIAFFVDGLNEVPAHIVEDNRLHDDVTAFLERIGTCSAVLATRFGEEHTALNLPEIALDAIPRDYVQEQLERRGVPLPEISEELLRLIERPVFYRFVLEHELWNVRTPHAIYTAVLERLSRRWAERFGTPLDLTTLFGRVAFDAIDVGDQLIAVHDLGDQLATHPDPPDLDTLVNWLLAEGMLVPRTSGHISFFHHSVVEHLAAHHLAERYQADRSELQHILQGRRWDHVVLLAIGFLPATMQDEFFAEVMRADATLALRALAYVERDWERWTEQALRHLGEIEAAWEDAMAIAGALSLVRISAQHEPQLLALSEQDDELAGVALARTLELGGGERVRRAIDALFARPDDHNRCTAIGEGLAEATDATDLGYLLTRLAEHPLDDEVAVAAARGQEEDAIFGLTSAAGIVLRAFDVATLRTQLGEVGEAPLLTRLSLLDMLWEDDSPAALELTSELLATDPTAAATALYFQLSSRDDVPDVSAFVPDLTGPSLIEAEVIRRDGFPVSALKCLADVSPAWRRWVRRRAEAQPLGILQAMLWYAGGRDDRFFAALEELHAGGVEWSDEPVGSLHIGMDADWRGHEQLLIALLRMRNDELTHNLLDSISVWWTADGSLDMSSLELGELSWWIDWIAEPRGERSDLVCNRLGHFIAAAADTDALREAFEAGSPEQRQALGRYVLPYIGGIRLEQLTPAIVAWAIDDLRTHSIGHASLLAETATEEFVEQRLLPLLDGAEGPLRSNLVELLRTTGERHRRRYVTTTGEMIEATRGSR